VRRIERVDARLSSYATVTPELALAQARHAEQRIMRREYLGGLHGVPIALKDLCWTKGVRTMAGMPLHAGFVPAEDGTVVERLRVAGSVLLGKLQLTEGAFADHHPTVTVPINPWHRDHWSGASSSGSGVATAAGLCFGSIGSDTGGSIRFPSIANGVTGLKPTWGRVSRHGAFELAASLDHIGPMARSAADCGLMLAAIAGADPDDPTALAAAVPDYLAGDSRRLDGFTVGIDEAYALPDLDAPVADTLADALRVLAGAGARVVPVRMPAVDEVVQGWVAHCGVEAAVAHAATYPARRAEYGPMLAGLLDTGLALSGADYQRILLARAAFTGRFDALMAQVDLLITPVMPFAGPSVARIAGLRQEPGYRLRLSRFTAPFDMSGHPTITLPSGFTSDGLPLAMQLVSGRLREDLLVRAGRVFQAITDWHTRRPPL